MKGDGWTLTKRGRWWVGYYHSGKEHREPAMVADARAPQGKRPARTEDEARRVLRSIIRGLDRGEHFTPGARRVTVNALLDSLLAWMTNQGHRSVAKLTCHMKPVRAFFGDSRAVAVTTQAVERYKTARLAEGRARATVNREVEGLRRAFSWGAKQQPPLVPAVPTMYRFPEDNARQGFLSRADFEAILGHVPDANVRDFIAWGFWTGMRKGEAAALTWEMLDRETWTLRLHARAAKTGKGRVLVLNGPLRTIMQRRIKARRLDSSLIFHRRAKGKPGQPVKDFRRLWAAACKSASVPAGRKVGLTFHDLRRTAVRNLVRAGVDPTIAMRISGHTTSSTFRRYNIVSEEDLAQAVEKVSAYVETLPRTRKVMRAGRRPGPIPDQT